MVMKKSWKRCQTQVERHALSEKLCRVGVRYMYIDWFVIEMSLFYTQYTNIEHNLISNQNVGILRSNHIYWRLWHWCILHNDMWKFKTDVVAVKSRLRRKVEGSFIILSSRRFAFCLNLFILCQSCRRSFASINSFFLIVAEHFSPFSLYLVSSHRSWSHKQ